MKKKNQKIFGGRGAWGRIFQTRGRRLHLIKFQFPVTICQIKKSEIGFTKPDVLDTGKSFPKETVFNGLHMQMNEERAKPFRLVKYFTIASLIVVFLGTVILSFLNVHWARAMQQRKSEDYARLLVENLNHQVFLQFMVPVVLKYGRVKLRDQAQREIMDKVVRSTLHSFHIEMVNIYDLENKIAYSFDPDLIGKSDAGGKAYFDALKGKSSSKLLQKGNWFEILIGFSEESRIITFAPLRAEKPLSGLSGPILGVVEIVQDLSEDYRAISKFQISVLITSLVVMGVLLLILIFVVKRGEGIIEKRAMERIRLKEQLSRAEHLSSLGEMVAAVSHEIRNPLGIIRSSAELLKKKVPTQDPANNIPEIIVEESSRLNHIITDFLNYARPKDPSFIPVGVDEIIQKNIHFLSPQIEEKNFRIETEFGDGNTKVLGDADMLYQAFLNILINAMQAMPQGGKITIGTRFEDHMVSIAFDDMGEGVPDSLLEKIWDPFFTTKEKGTGLGLGIVKNIIKAHGGEIRIHNRAGGGARVVVDLPIKPDEV